MSSQVHQDKSGSNSRKIRDSCTACSQQKLRCSKDRPACERCKTRGIECNYVISMRTGRPPRNSKSNGSNSSNGSSHDNASVSGSSSSRNGSPPLQPSSYPTQNLEYGYPPTSAPMTGPSSAPPMWAPSPGLESLLQPVSLQMSGDEDLWSEQASVNFSNELESLFGDNTGLQGFSAFMPLADPPMMSDVNTSIPSSMPSGSGMSQPSMFTPSMYAPPMKAPQQDSRTGSSVAQRGGRSTTLPARIPSNQTTRQQLPQTSGDRFQCSRSQNCMAKLFDLTLEMYVSDQRCTTASANSSTDMHQKQQQQSRDVDAVLFRNREAIRTITKTLDCPCWTDPGITLAAYMLAAKIVAWYGAILCVEGETPLEGESNTIAGCITARSISVGSYRLDAHAQRSVRANVVLGELRNLVQPMIEKMPLVQSSNVGDDGKPGAIALADCMLRQQMQQVIVAAS